MSTKILIITKNADITITAPITIGKSSFCKALISSLPIPSQPKIRSTNTAPASNDANQPETAVITGFSAFFKACLKIIE